MTTIFLRKPSYKGAFARSRRSSYAHGITIARVGVQLGHNLSRKGVIPLQEGNGPGKGALVSPVNLFCKWMHRDAFV